MNKSIKSLLAVAAFGAFAAFALAQPAPKIVVVDLASLFDKHYKTEEQGTKLRADEQKAQEELDRMNKEGNAMVDRYKELAGEAESAVLAPEAKAKAAEDVKKVYQDIQRKQQEVQAFQQNTRSSLQQRMKAFHDLMLEEISKVAVDIAKRKGANLLLDRSGQTLNGVPGIVYSDAEFDITADVMKEINKDRPASVTPTTTTTPSGTPAADGSPNITLPGAKKN